MCTIYICALTFSTCYTQNKYYGHFILAWVVYTIFVPMAERKVGRLKYPFFFCTCESFFFFKDYTVGMQEPYLLYNSGWFWISWEKNLCVLSCKQVFICYQIQQPYTIHPFEYNWLYSAICLKFGIFLCSKYVLPHHKR